MDRASVLVESGLAVPYWKLRDGPAAAAFRALVDAAEQAIPADRVLEVASDATKAVYFVASGWVTISRSTVEGHRQIIDFLLPGQLFDPRSANEHQAFADLVTLTDARIAIIPHNAWHRVLQEHREIQHLLNRFAAAHTSRIAERMLRIGKGKADSRIAYALCELCLRTCETGLVNGTAFHIPLTQQVLGDFVGLSSVHVSRTFRRLKRQGILSVGSHMDVLIHDAGKLAEIAEIDPADLRAEIITAA